MPKRAPIIVWFRLDLRLSDNPALSAAAATGAPLLPVYVLDDDAGSGLRPPGGAARWWLHGSLAALERDLAGRGLPLLLRRGREPAVLAALAREAGAGAVHWNRRYGRAAEDADAAVATALAEAGVRFRSFAGGLLHEPRDVGTKAGGAYAVFTPFARACRARPVDGPLPAPELLIAPPGPPRGAALADWGLLPAAPDWAGGLRDAWTPGEAGAAARLARFLEGGLGRYAAERDRPDCDVTSRLSPHLHWGEISPRQVWHAAALRGDGANAARFQDELLWREFNHHLLHHRPEMPEAPLQQRFARFPWRPDARLLRAWQRGRTGYPIVDAGMRELWATGWMHNRVRMIAASFLVKDLLQPWQDGEAWFWDTLVDADLANNAGNWQWVAGCGADAAPFFRIFNPVLQGRKFDPRGAYVRAWVPELARLPDAHVHAPWQAPEGVLQAAGIRLGTDYPRPMVDHAVARAQALEALRATTDAD